MISNRKFGGGCDRFALDTGIVHHPKLRLPSGSPRCQHVLNTLKQQFHTFFGPFWTWITVYDWHVLVWLATSYNWGDRRVVLSRCSFWPCKSTNNFVESWKAPTSIEMSERSIYAYMYVSVTRVQSSSHMQCWLLNLNNKKSYSPIMALVELFQLGIIFSPKISPSTSTSQPWRGTRLGFGCANMAGCTKHSW